MTAALELARVAAVAGRRRIALTPEVAEAIAAHAVVAIGVSGGKDSQALAFALTGLLAEVGHTGEVLLVHADLGAIEWKTSVDHCRALADRLGLELVVVRRKAGGLIERFGTRWESSVRRYAALECVKLVKPFSSAGARFCTGELKLAPLFSYLVKRFRGRTILSASGVRRQESARRRASPVAKAQPKLTRKGTRGGLPTSGRDWHPIVDWTLEEVLASSRERAFPLHEAYTRYGSSRLSCSACVLASEADLRAAASCPDNREAFLRLVDLEIVSTFAYQEGRWLGDVAAHLLDEDRSAALRDAQARARRRERAEARIPGHLLYDKKGWPRVEPTPAEARLLAEVRREVADAVGLEIGCDTPEAVLARYRELMALNGQLTFAF